MLAAPPRPVEIIAESDLPTRTSGPQHAPTPERIVIPEHPHAPLAAHAPVEAALIAEGD